MSLEKDNKSHRGMSDNLDKAYGAMSKSKCPYQVYRGAVYEKVTRPVIHGAYHGARHIKTGNPAELARAKDQFSKIGTGQSQADYLKQHREEAKKMEQKK